MTEIGVSRGTPLDHALVELHFGVVEIPKGSNRGPRVDRYTGGRAEPWCGHFVAWCYFLAGKTIPGFLQPSPTVASPLASVQFMEDTFKKYGWWWPVGDAKKGLPGPSDLIFLKGRGKSDPATGSSSPSAATRGRHVGIVETMDAAYVVSIDGNWGDGVRRVRRLLSPETISGFGRMP